MWIFCLVVDWFISSLFNTLLDRIYTRHIWILIIYIDILKNWVLFSLLHSDDLRLINLHIDVSYWLIVYELRLWFILNFCKKAWSSIYLGNRHCVYATIVVSDSWNVLISCTVASFVISTWWSSFLTLTALTYFGKLLLL